MSAPLYVNTIGVVAAACSMGSARYGSFEFSASSPDVSLMALQFREGQRFVYEYDLNIPWRHEVRIEAWPEPAAGKTYPTCIGGHGTCPPEDCGGPAAFMARRDDVVSMDMLEDLAEMAEILEPFILERRPEVLDDEAKWRLEDALERAHAREAAQGRPFALHRVNARLRRDEYRELMHQQA